MQEYKIPLKNILKEIVAYAFVDEEEFEKINSFKWYLSNGYARSSKNEIMHRYIMGANIGDKSVDHINGNKLDNRKSNLRFVTSSQNSQNRPKKEGRSSKYIGVSYRKKKIYGIVHVLSLMHILTMKNMPHIGMIKQH